MTAITKLTDRFTEADIDQEIVIMVLSTGEFFSLSGTAATIWRLIDGERNESDLVTATAKEFDASDSDIAADIQEFLAQLRETGLLADR